MARTYAETRRAFRFLNLAQNSSLNDLYCVYIVLALGLAQRTPPGKAPEQDAGLNLLTVAEMTGIPRETARRKIHRLIESGFVVRHPSGEYGLTSSAILEKVVGPLMSPAI